MLGISLKYGRKYQQKDVWTRIRLILGNYALSLTSESDRKPCGVFNDKLRCLPLSLSLYDFFMCSIYTCNVLMFGSSGISLVRREDYIGMARSYWYRRWLQVSPCAGRCLCRTWWLWRGARAEPPGSWFVFLSSVIICDIHQASSGIIRHHMGNSAKFDKIQLRDLRGSGSLHAGCQGSLSVRTHGKVWI